MLEFKIGAHRIVNAIDSIRYALGKLTSQKLTFLWEAYDLELHRT